MDYNAEFLKKLDQLNDEQRAAVEQVDGPVMVVAGPGTGKTQLLAMRVANILRQTDVLPSNILCLTFTEAAATNMVERLATIIGADAYKVEISTFHGFGSSIISRYGEYFYNGADYQPADELTQGEIINDALAKLPFNNPLRAMNKGQFTYLRDLQSLIKDMKKAAISPDELRQMANQNLDFCRQISKSINTVFSQRINAKLLDQLQSLACEAEQIADSQPQLDFTTEPKLGDVFADELQTAINGATSGDKITTTPLSNFKKKWCEKATVAGAQLTVLKDQKRSERIRLAADIYETYLQAMDERSLYDFGDMIMNVINAIDKYPDLKANLQEQYQYILVDEFQDTNDAQMRLLAELTDYDNQPNIMVVGDDDQAIYRFQGADISNIQQFAKRFTGSLVQINLKNNYRSGADILSASQVVSTGISDRLTNADGSPKQLVAMTNPTTSLRMVTTSTAEQELDYVAQSIREAIDNGDNPGSIAVIGRKHSSLEQIVPYLAQYNIKVSYERQRDVFQSPLVELLVHLAKLVYGMATGNHSDINDHLPLVLASPAFGISQADYYRLSLAASGRGEEWIKRLSANPQTSRLIDWLQCLAKESQTKSLNAILLELIGTVETETNENNDDPERQASDRTSFRSPIFHYYFDYKRLPQNALLYLGLLNDITTLLSRLKEYMPDKQPKLADFIHFVDQCQELGVAIYATASVGDKNNVQLMSAHGSKGLEFQTVYIVDAESEQWGSKSRSRSGNLPYPANMPFGTPAGNDDDERRRLLFVAMTRAKQNLVITAHSARDNGKELNQLEYLLEFPNQTTLPEPDVVSTIQQTELSLMDRIVEPSADQKDLLAPRLANYHLSATDLNAFTDVMNGGPTYFLLYNLLRIPAGTSGALIFGNATHHTMQRIHNIVQQGGAVPAIDRVLEIFHKQFDAHAYDIPADEAKVYRDKGDHALTTYMNHYSTEFNVNQSAEQQFKAVLDGDIRITGKLDCLEIDRQNRTIRITDYKTGKGFSTFSERGDDYTKAKTRRYLQQLMFYKLLIEKSGQFEGYRVISGQLDFVEPDRDGNLFRPTTDYSDIDMTEFTRLVRSVWNHIINLDLPDISNYSQDYKGIVAFEGWLRDNP